MRIRPGFTLLELLVVVSVIAILVAMLLPAISLVRASADNLVCQNNLRQIGLASFNYAQDFDGILPAGAAGGHPKFARDHFWAKSLNDYLGIQWDWDVPYTWNNASMKVPVYRCPTNRYAENSWVPLKIHYIIHNDMSNLWGVNNDAQARAWGSWHYLARLPRPAAQVQMFIDMNTSGSSWGIELEHGDTWGYMTGSITRDPGMQVSFRHRRKCNLVLADGRVAQYYNPAMAVPVEQRWSHILPTGGP